MKIRLFTALTAVALALALLIPPLARAQSNAQQLAADSVVETIKKRGAIRVGMSTFVPWAMRDKNGELIGYEIDIAKRLAEDMQVKAEFVPTAWDGIIPALLAGKFDVVIGGMSITPERNLTVNFTLPYANSGIHMVANKAISGKKLTGLAMEWSVAVPPLAKGGEGGFEPRGLTPPVKIPPNPPFSKGGDNARFGITFSRNRLRSWRPASRPWRLSTGPRSC